jgi:hypothetical protein
MYKASALRDQCDMLLRWIAETYEYYPDQFSAQAFASGSNGAFVEHPIGDPRSSQAPGVEASAPVPQA